MNALARIIQAPRKNYDTVSIEERAGRSEGTETNTFNAVFGARLGARIFPRCSLHNVGLQASPRQRPIAFALKGALLDHCHHWSSRAMARTGLRMMPTFPSPPLKFRTAGFPRYGFKASMSDRAFLQVNPLKPAPGMRSLTRSLLPPFARFHPRGS